MPLPQPAKTEFEAQLLDIVNTRESKLKGREPTEFETIIGKYGGALLATPFYMAYQMGKGMIDYAIEFPAMLKRVMDDPLNPQSQKEITELMVDVGTRAGLTTKAMPASTLGLFGGKGAKVKPKEGWFKNPYDKKWRFEIDDSKMSWKDGRPIGVNKSWLGEFYNEVRAKGEGPVTFGDLFEHKELFEAYPQIKNVRMVHNPNAKGGTYYASNNSIVMDMSAKERMDIPQVELIIHEIQHAVQEIEGFARGGSPEQVFYKHKERIAKTAIPKLMDYSVAIEKSVGREYLQSNPDVAEWLYLRDLKPSDVAAEAKVLYHNLAGEIEAREAAARWRLTPQERLDIASYKKAILPEEAIVRFDK